MNSVENPALDNVLAIINRPDIISFAGGLPAPDCFPVEEMAAAFAETLAEDKGSALQYGACDGFRPLKEWVATYMVERQAMASCSPDEVLITSGSQQGIELIARALLEPGDRVIVESPSYMAALQVFSNIEAVSIAAPSDEDGLITEGLAELIRKEKPKFIYVIPTFQNPSGITMTLKRRKELIKIAHEEGIPILEDNPYGFKVDCIDLDTDHIIPISTGKSEEDMYKLTHYTNLQLLPKDYNQHIKRDNPFDREHFEKWLIETKYNKC